MDNNNELRRRKLQEAAGAAEGLLPNGDLTTTQNVGAKTFPYAWTFGVMSSCLFLTVVLMPLLAFYLPTTPRDDLPWWQKTSIYEIKTREFHDSDGNGLGDIKGITKSLQHLQWIGVTGILLDSIFSQAKGSSSGAIDFYAVDSSIGTMAHFEELIATMQNNGIQVVLDLEINHSHLEHPWFKSSRSGDSKYKDYYVWSDGKKNSDGKLEPPNNWLSISGGSAWSYDDSRQQYFLHQFHPSLPDLNFHNPAVVDEVKNIIRFWLAKGVDGFLISNADYLVASTQVSLNEPRSCNHDALPTDHDYLLHRLTRQVPLVHNLTNQWREVVDEQHDPGSPRYQETKQKKSVLLLIDSWPAAEGEDLEFWNKHNMGKTHLALNYALAQTIRDKVPCGGSCIESHVAKVRDLGAVDALSTWSALQSRRITKDTGDYADVYNILVLLLPGTPLTQAGQETGKCRQHTYNSIKEAQTCQLSMNLFKRLHQLRQKPAFLWGRLESAVNNENIYSFFRHAKGWSYSKYLVTVNVGNEASNNSYVGSNSQFKCPEKGTVVATTKLHPARKNDVRPGNKVSLDDFIVYPGEGFVIVLK